MKSHEGNLVAFVVGGYKFTIKFFVKVLTLKQVSDNIIRA